MLTPTRRSERVSLCRTIATPKRPNRLAPVKTPSPSLLSPLFSPSYSLRCLGKKEIPNGHNCLTPNFYFSSKRGLSEFRRRLGQSSPRHHGGRSSGSNPSGGSTSFGQSTFPLAWASQKARASNRDGKARTARVAPSLAIQTLSRANLSGGMMRPSSAQNARASPPLTGRRRVSHSPPTAIFCSQEAQKPICGHTPHSS